MKAERRHELKENALAKKVESAPAFFQQYGSRILLAIVFAVLIYVLINNHFRDKEVKDATARRSLGTALYALNQLRQIPGRAPQEMISNLRREYSHDAENAISEVLNNSDDPRIRAGALVAKGDLDWDLANFPALPGATTRPELNADKTSDVYLTDAADAYNQVLEAPLNSDEASVTAARLSLGKIAENRSQWDEAKKYYQQVIDDAAADKGFKDQAQADIDALKDLKTPVYVGNGDSLFSVPRQSPSLNLPAPVLPPVAVPATAPSTQSAR